MPRLQQLADRCGAAPEKSVEETKPQHATASSPTPLLRLLPPKPTAVLFNVVDGYAYQVTVSRVDGLQHAGVCIFAVRRVPLLHTRLLLLHISAATRSGLPFCTVRGAVTWHDVMLTVAPLDPQLRSALFGWNVQVLGLDAAGEGLRPITPALSSPLESHYFLHTNVEVLFAHYKANTLNLRAAPVVPNPAGADWHTPPDRSTEAAIAAPPSAPVKKPRRAPRQVRMEEPPRRLADDFSDARTPSSHGTQGEVVAWSRTSFLQQQARWVRRCMALRHKIAGATLSEVLEMVTEELRRYRRSSTLPSSLPQSKGAATWTLSLIEYRCQLHSDFLHAQCISIAAADTVEGDAAVAPLPTWHADLHAIRAGAVKVCGVVNGIWEAHEQAQADGAVPPSFPSALLLLLLTTLRLRGLRHAALVFACVGAPTEAVEKPEYLDADAARRLHQLASKDDLLRESMQATVLLLQALVGLQETREDVQLPLAALMSPLLSSLLSLAELSAYISMDAVSRCMLLRAALHVCRCRLQWMAPCGDTKWLPQCVRDVASRMQATLDGTPLMSSAFAAYAELTDLLRDVTAYADDMNAAAAVTGGEQAVGCPAQTGYTLQLLTSTEDVDAAFLSGNTVVREVRRRIATLSPSAAPQSKGTQEVEQQAKP